MYPTALSSKASAYRNASWSMWKLFLPGWMNFAVSNLNTNSKVTITKAILPYTDFIPY